MIRGHYVSAVHLHQENIFLLKNAKVLTKTTGKLLLFLPTYVGKLSK